MYLRAGSVRLPPATSCRRPASPCTTPAAIATLDDAGKLERVIVERGRGYVPAWCKTGLQPKLGAFQSIPSTHRY